MSYCREEGKDKIIFVTEEDHAKPPNINISEYEDEPGLILPNGEINWNCPCLGGMATGPCGYEFRESFSCVRNSSAEMKGSDCFDQFKAMIDCFKKHPDVYGNYDDEMEDSPKDDDAEARDDRVESNDENADSEGGNAKLEEEDQSKSKSDTTRSSDT